MKLLVSLVDTYTIIVILVRSLQPKIFVIPYINVHYEC